MPTADQSQSGRSDVSSALVAVEEFRASYAAVRAEVEKVIVGHRSVVDGVLTCLFCDGHVLLEGVPGLGKTLLIRTLARALDLSFSRIQFTPDLMPADISGTTIVVEVEKPGAHSPSRQFAFQPGPVFAQIVLADEINRATPKTQSALLEAMQERSVTIGGTTHPLPRPFLVMATQNPIEQEGTYPLPEAQLDRFFFKLLVGPSGRGELAEILNRTTTGTAAAVERVLNAERIVAFQQLVHRAAIAPPILDYAVRLTLAPTRATAAGAPERARRSRRHWSTATSGSARRVPRANSCLPPSAAAARRACRGVLRRHRAVAPRCGTACC